MHTHSEAEKALGGLSKNFKLVGKDHVHSWYAWAIVGIVLGMATMMVYVANQSAQFVPSGAAVGDVKVYFSEKVPSGGTLHDALYNNAGFFVADYRERAISSVNPSYVPGNPKITFATIYIDQNTNYLNGLNPGNRGVVYINAAKDKAWFAQVNNGRADIIMSAPPSVDGTKNIELKFKNYIKKNGVYTLLPSGALSGHVTCGLDLGSCNAYKRSFNVATDKVIVPRGMPLYVYKTANTEILKIQDGTKSYGDPNRKLQGFPDSGTVELYWNDVVKGTTKNVEIVDVKFIADPVLPPAPPPTPPPTPTPVPPPSPTPTPTPIPTSNPSASLSSELYNPQMLCSASTQTAIASFVLVAHQSEGIRISSLSFDKDAPKDVSSRLDLQNLKVFIGSEQFGTTKTTVGSQETKMTFSSAAPATIAAGGAVIVRVYADILSSSANGGHPSPIDLVDWSVAGTLSGSSKDFPGEVAGQSLYLSCGPALTFSESQSMPPAANLVMGSTNNPLLAVTMRNGNIDDVRLNDITFHDTIIGGGSAPSFQNFQLYNGSTRIAGPVSASSGANSTAGGYYITFSLTTPLVIQKNSAVTLTLKADVATHAAGAISGSKHTFKTFEEAVSVQALNSASSQVLLIFPDHSGSFYVGSNTMTVY